MPHKNFITSTLIITFALRFFTTELYAQSPAPVNQLPVNGAIRRLEKDIPKYMKLSNTPGLSIALIRDGKLVWLKGFGVTNSSTRQPVTTRTIFEANSLSKPLFALAVLTLVDQGKLALDTPFINYEGGHFDYCDDPQFKQVTIRMILSHSSGIVTDAKDTKNKIALEFPPGKQFRYSPTGYQILSKLIEKITDMKIEDFIKQAVLDPLNMKSSSYVWQPAYDSLRIYQHDWAGNVNPDRYKWKRGAACCSLQTNPEDYAKFVIAMLDNTLLKTSTLGEMMKPQIPVGAKFPELSWGLGWGLEKSASTDSFWHWGDSGASRNYISAYITQKDAVLFFTNGENGLSFASEVLTDAIGGTHQGLAYLDYERYDAPSWLLLKDILEKGAVQALKKHTNTNNPGEIPMNAIGYRLIGIKRLHDAIVVFEQNTTDFPKSANTWDSLAEAYMDNGDKTSAVNYYKKSLELNPANENARQMLQKLANGNQ